MHAPADPTPRFDQRLREAGRARALRLGGRFLLRMIKYLLLALVVLAALDLVLQLNNKARLGLALAMLLGIVAVLAVGFWKALIHTPKLETTARFLEERDPTLGSKLINVLQLREKAEDPELEGLTRMLAERAVSDAAGEVSEVPFAPLTRLKNVRREWILVIAPFAALLLACTIFWGPAKASILRYFDPYGGHPPFSFTRLQIVEPEAGVADVLYGGSLLIRASFEGHEPEKVVLSAFDPSPEGGREKLEMFHKGEHGFVQELQNIRENMIVQVHTPGGRSKSRPVEVKVILTPQFETATVSIQPPSYTKLPTTDKGYHFKGLRVLEGSEITVSVDSNRPLAGGTLTYRGTADGDQKVPLSPEPSPQENRASGSFIANSSGALQFQIEDVTGLRADAENEGTLTVTHDLPPTISFTSPNGPSFIVENHQAEIILDASDDFGLAKVRLHRGLNGIYSGPKETLLNQGERADRSESPRFILDCAALGVRSGDQLSFFGEAIDTRPDPQYARTKTVSLMVISEEEYNDYLRTQRDIGDIQEKYTQLMDSMHEILDSQEALAEKAAEIAEKLANGELTEEQAAEELAKLSEEQESIDDQLDALAQEMSEATRENPLYDMEKQLGESLDELAEAIKQSTEENRQASPSDPKLGQAKEDLEKLAEAAEKQMDNLRPKQEEVAQQIQEPIEDAELMQEILKDFNTFKRLFEMQEAVTSQAKAYADRGELAKEDRLALRNLGAQEKQIEETLEKLREKLEEDSEAAAETFPKASESAQNLADAIGELRIPPSLASASLRMLQGQGEPSYQSAERARAAMESLF